MLDVTGCTCPTGLVWRGVFDATGVQYKVPEWVVVEPEGVVEEDEDEEGVGAEVEEEEEDEGDEEVDVRVRTSHDSKDVTIRVHRKESVAKVIEKIKDEAKVCLLYICIDISCHLPLGFTQDFLSFDQTNRINSSALLPESGSHMAGACITSTRAWRPIPIGTLIISLLYPALCFSESTVM